MRPATSDRPQATRPWRLNLRQMGAIPLLNRVQELSMAIALENARDRFRHAALLCGPVLRRTLATFKKVKAGELLIDPVIEVVTSRGKTRDAIQKKLPTNLTTLQRFTHRLDAEFVVFMRADSQIGRKRGRLQLWRTLQKAARIAEELSPRTEIIEHWVNDLIAKAAHGGKLEDIMRDHKKFTAKALAKAIAENGRESRKEWILPLLRKSDGGIHFWGPAP